MLSRIEISNFKAIKETPLVLDGLAPVNYLVGPNGCGKSSVLEGIQFLDDIPCPQDDGEIIVDPCSKFIDYCYKADTDESTPNKPTRISYIFNKMTDRERLFDIVQDIDGSFFLEDYNSQEELKYERIELCNFKTTTDFIKDILSDEDNELFNELISHVCDVLDFHFEEDEVVNILKEDRVYNWNSSSQGEKIYIYLIYYLLSTKNSEYDILLLEEPETNLYPYWQKILPIALSKIAEHKGFQFLISTHSPFIISAAAKEDGQKVYLIEGGQTVDLAGRKGFRANGFEDEKCLAVASKMLGAGLSDISNFANLQNKYNVFYCENTDAEIYNLLFPKTDDRKNIFIGAGGADEVIRAFYSGSEALKIAFGKDTEIFALVDRSCSGGKGLDTKNGYITTDKNKPVFTDGERTSFLETNESYRMLERKEIENYLFDPKIIEKFNETAENKISLNIADYNLEVKDRLEKKYKGNMEIYLQLAQIIHDTPTLQVYQDLHNLIFT